MNLGELIKSISSQHATQLFSNDSRYYTYISVFGSIMECFYGIGKLVAGPLSDLNIVSPTYMLIISLTTSALCNLFMFKFNSFDMNLFIWALNGWAQSFAWPAIAMIFLDIFGESKNKATMYSILSTSQNVGSALTPIVLTPLLNHYGWLSCLRFPGLIALLYSLFIHFYLQNDMKPKDDKNAVKKNEGNNNSSKTDKSMIIQMIKSKWIWYLGIGYGLLTAIRISLTDWTMVILKEYRGLSVEYARDSIVSFEIGGFIGSIFAGVLSDRVFKGSRSIVMMIFSILVIPASMGIILIPNLSQDTMRLSLMVLNFVCGFGIFGPHMLVGLVSREIFPQTQSTAGEITKALGQMGGVLAGYPLSFIIRYLGWYSVAYIWGLCAIFASCCFFGLLISNAESKRDISLTNPSPKIERKEKVN